MLALVGRQYNTDLSLTVLLGWWGAQKDFFIDNLLARIHFISEMIWRTGLAP